MTTFADDLGEDIPFTTRDYVAEMAALIQEATAEGGYTPPILAEKIVTSLREQDPELLTGWLHALAPQFIRQAINQLDHSRRARAAATHRRAEFAAAAAAHENGDPDALDQFLSATWTVEDQSRKSLRAMDKGDLVYVAGKYEARVADNRLWGQFFRALARKLEPGQTVHDVYTEDQISAMFSGLRESA